MPEPTPQKRPTLQEQFVTETIPVGLPWRLLVFALTLFIFSLFVYFGLRFGYESYISTQAEDLDMRIEELGQRVSQEDQQGFINFYSQLINLRKVLDQHGFSVNIFGFLERNTLGDVYYNDANFLALDSALVLKGVANSSETLVSQLTLFDGAEEIDRVVLNQMSSGRGVVTFGVTLFFNPDFFKKPTL